ncbi:MAG: zinc ribbon domain-containing protein [Methanomassiliicoccales archaeon]
MRYGISYSEDTFGYVDWDLKIQGYLGIIFTILGLVMLIKGLNSRMDHPKTNTQSYVQPQNPAPVPLSQSLFCNQCGRQIPSDALFCPYCGKQVNRQL